MLDEELLRFGQRFHGHKCPAMPMGLRAALAAMEKLGVSRAPDGQLVALIEIDEDHCATCFADGVQVATGCTLGKGNIRKLHFGKWGLTLVDRRNGKAVRVVPRTEVMRRNKQSKFMELRASGVPASQVPDAVVDPLVEMVVNMPETDLLVVGEVYDHAWKDAPHTFETVACEACGEMVVTRNARLLDGRVVCIPCSGYGR